MIWSAFGTRDIERQRRRDIDFCEVVIWSNCVARDMESRVATYVIIKRNEAASSLVSE